LAYFSPPELACMFHFNKQIPRLQQQQHDRMWQPFIMNVMPGKKVGFVGFGEEAINTPFCPLQEKFHPFVLRGLRNISEAP
jgi:hypothetical protein